MIARVEFQDSYVYIQVTRGVAPRDHAYPVNCEPTVFAMARPLPVIEPLSLKQGLKARRVKDIRWDRCDIKVTSLLANVMLKQSAISDGCHEAIFVRDGRILEGSATNIFTVMNDAVYTAPKNHLILPGITRDFVVELLRELGIPLTEEAPQESSCEHFQEIWMTSSTKEVLPITVLDHEKVGTGRPGPLWERVYTAFQSRKAAYGREDRV
jgi:D-alanine transaminase